MAKFAIFLVALMLVGTGRCYASDIEATVSGLPVVGPMVDPPPGYPAYVDTIGTPAPSGLPEADLSTWFAADQADPYDVTLWREVATFVAVMDTPKGFAEACKAAGAAAGTDRASNPALAALACSSDGTVTQLQHFAAGLLALRAEVALWYRGAPGASLGAIEARQGELRLQCEIGVGARQGAGSVYEQACAAALVPATDPPALFAAIGTAYTAVAGDIATRDPDIDSEPGYFQPAAATP